MSGMTKAALESELAEARARMKEAYVALSDYLEIDGEDDGEEDEDGEDSDSNADEQEE